MKTFKTLKWMGILFMFTLIFSACEKQETLLEFIEQPIPPPPPPPPLSNDLKNVQFVYNGAEKKTSMIARRTFDPYLENPPSGRYCNGFEFAIRLDDNETSELFQKLQIKLPLDDKGELVPGKYIIEDNEITEGGDVNIIYTKGITSTILSDANYSTGKANFTFNMILRLEKFDNKTHEVAGFIDELSIMDKNDPSKKINLTGLGFTLNYDHFEIYLNDALAYEGATSIYGNSEWYLGTGNADVYAASATAPFTIASLGFSILDYKGVGNYQSETVVDVDYGPINSSFNLFEGSGVGAIDNYMMPQISPVATHEINIETALENVLIKGTLSATAAKVWGRLDWGNPVLVPNTPVYKLRGSFFQRKL